MNTNAILAAAAVLLAIPTGYTILSERGNFTEYDTIPRLFEGFTIDNIKAVVLTVKKEGAENVKPNPNLPPGQVDPATVDQLVFQKVDDKWFLSGQNELAGAPIQQSKMDNDVLQHVKAIRRDERALVDADAPAEEMAKRGLTEDSGILIQCLTAENMSVAELFRGNDASGGQFGKDAVKGWFVARKGRNDIILYEPNPPYWNLTVKAEDWLDKKVQEFQLDQVKAFTLRNPEGEIRFTRAASGEAGPEGAATRDWVAETTPEGKAAVRQQEINNLLSRFNYVSCSRYLGHVQSPKWAPKVPRANNAEIEVSATLEDGTRYVMWVGTKIADKNEYYARFEGGTAGQFLVAIGEWIRQPFIDKKIGDLFDPAAPTGEPKKPGEEGQAPAPVTPPANAGEGPAKTGEQPPAGDPKTGEPKTEDPKTGEPKTGEPKTGGQAAETTTPKTEEPAKTEKTEKKVEKSTEPKGAGQAGTTGTGKG